MPTAVIHICEKYIFYYKIKHDYNNYSFNVTKFVEINIFTNYLFSFNIAYADENY